MDGFLANLLEHHVLDGSGDVAVVIQWVLELVQQLAGDGLDVDQAVAALLYGDDALALVVDLGDRVVAYESGDS